MIIFSKKSSVRIQLTWTFYSYTYYIESFLEKLTSFSKNFFSA